MLTREQIQTLIEAGGTAPSGGNIQPWRVTADPSRIAIWLDEERSSSFLDVERRASLLALGSFAENLAITARALGLRWTLEQRSDMTLDAPMLVFRFTGSEAPHAQTGIDASLRRYLPERCTNRRPHDGPSASAADIAEMAAALAGECRLDAVGPPDSMADEMAAVAQVLAECDAFRLRHRLLHEQMWAEVRFDPEEVEATGDGVDVATLELPAGAEQALARLASYEFVQENLSAADLVAMSLPALTASSHLCCLTVPSPAELPTVARMLAVGRALERMWLTATRLQLAIQPWTVLTFLLMRARFSPEHGFSAAEHTQLSELHRRFTAGFGLPEDAVPVFAFRVARCAPPSKRALRRDWRSYSQLRE